MITPVPLQCLMVDDATSMADALAQTQAWLVEHGMDALDAELALQPRSGLVARAWWGGDGVGFVGEEHPDARPVLVVDLIPEEAPAWPLEG